jgi:hypothetical protein
MINRLKAFFKIPAKDRKGKAPNGVCPNCWGAQEYDNQIRDMYIDKQIDVNNNETNHTFIQDFVINKISGIKLQKGDNSFQCPTCRVAYPDK